MASPEPIAACSSRSSASAMSRCASAPILPVAPTTATLLTMGSSVALARAPLRSDPGRRSGRRGAARRVLREPRARVHGWTSTAARTRIRRRSSRPPARSWCVFDEDDTPAGCGGVRMLSADRGEIKHLWLRDGFRGRGWGRTCSPSSRRARSASAPASSCSTRTRRSRRRSRSTARAATTRSSPTTTTRTRRTGSEAGWCRQRRIEPI